MKCCAITDRSYGQIAHNGDRHKPSVLQLGALQRTSSAFGSSLGIPYKTKERYGLRYLGVYYKTSFIVTASLPIVNSLLPRIAEFLDMSSIEPGLVVLLICCAGTTRGRQVLQDSWIVRFCHKAVTPSSRHLSSLIAIVRM